MVLLEVMAFNVWGMPAGLGGCKYKQQRMDALHNLLIAAEDGDLDFDVLLLEELWMSADHENLANASRKAGLHMTAFRELASR